MLQLGERRVLSVIARAFCRAYLKFFYWISVPIGILTILDSRLIHESYKMSTLKKLQLGYTMLQNTRRIPCGTPYKAHLAMAMKILETPPEVPGDIVECGTWKGASAANLSLVCRIVGRKLKIFDSFEGLPEGRPEDRQAPYYRKGDYAGTLEEVKSNITRYGAVECCEFVKGWFEDTLPKLNSPVLLAFLDVDLESSLDTCVRHIWRNLVEDGYIFTNECVGTDYVALFYSEKWWQKNFHRTPPGLIGAGTGLPLGDYYIGPYSERDDHPSQRASSGGYTKKNMSGCWTYYHDEIAQSGAG